MSSRVGAVLGIHAFGAHDTSAALIDGSTGEIVFALAEERLSNVKHDARFPIGCITLAAETAQARGQRISDVAVNFDAVQFIRGTLFAEIARYVSCSKGRRQLEQTVLDCFRFGDGFRYSGSFTQRTIDQAIATLKLPQKTALLLRARVFWYFNWAHKHKSIEAVIETLFPEANLHRVQHHQCHAAAGFYNSGFRDAAVLVVDGQGECDTASIYRGDGTALQRRLSCGWPASLGMFYLSVTEHLGFRLGDEYKVMGMAAYGRHTYLDLLRECLRYDAETGLREVETAYYARRDKVVHGRKTGHFVLDFTDAFTEVVPSRRHDETVEQIHFDLAASAQALLEELGVKLAGRAIELADSTNLVVAGGVALNGLMNARIRKSSGCHDLFVFPASADDGTAVGAAQWVAADRGSRPMTRLRHTFFGQILTPTTIEPQLQSLGVKFRHTPEIHDEIAHALARGKIVARYVGRDEFGPRALGHRSILASPTFADMKDRINGTIKCRESFRPFAPACLLEHASAWFDHSAELPFMLEVVQAQADALTRVPAVIHADGTSRLQTVSRDTQADLYRIITSFANKTGVPIILNTSFNVNGETIVNTIQDAVESFVHMGIDILAIDNYWIDKTENLHLVSHETRDEFLDRRKKRYHTRFPHILRNFKLDRYDYLGDLATLPLDPGETSP